jgi:hypothetical protein
VQAVPQQPALATPDASGTQAIDTRTGKPADASTPPQFVEVRGSPTPSSPTAVSPTGGPPTATPTTPTVVNRAIVPAAATSRPASGSNNGKVAISSPAGGHVSGPVAITGSASTANMQYYRIEYSLPGGGWSSIGQWTTPVSGGTLATWSTSGLQAGQYTIRLTVQDSQLGSVTSTVNVTVG